MSNKMVIYHQYFSPAYKAGGPVRSLVNLVNAIKAEVERKDKVEVEQGVTVTLGLQSSKSGGEIIVVCSAKDLDGSDLKVSTNKILEHQLGGFQVCYGPSRLSLWRIVQKPQVAYINGLFSFRYNLLPFLFCRGKRILAPRGMLAKEALAKKSYKKRPFLILLNLILRQFPVVFHATSLQEKEDILREFGNSQQIVLIPNVSQASVANQLGEKKQGQLKLGTIALIGSMKNHLQVIKALKEIKEPVEYSIWGPIMDANYWDLCLNEIKHLPNNIVVCYHGACQPEEVTMNMASVDVIIQPSESENYGHSLVEAMSIGRPIITSFQTPWQSLELHKAGLNVNPQPADIQKAISCFVEMDSETYKHWCIGANTYISDRLKTEETLKSYLSLFTLNAV